jgi:PAS domain S-box-containing protein
MVASGRPSPDAKDAAGERPRGLASLLQWHAPSIRSQLFRLVLVALLPVLVFAAIAAWESYQDQQRTAELELLQTARAVSAAFDGELGRRESRLDALAHAPSLAAGDLARFYDIAKAASGGAPISVRDVATGRELLNTGRPLGQPGPALFDDSDWRSEALRGQVPEASGVGWSPLEGGYLVVAEAPVHVGGRVRYVLQMGETADQLMGILKRYPMPSPWVASVVDRRGVCVACTGALAVGRGVAPDMIELARRRIEGVIRQVAPEGARMVRAVVHSPSTGFAVLISVPEQAFAANLMESAAWIFLGGVAAAALGITCAALMARRVSGPLRAAAAMARSIGDGPPARLEPSGVAEIDVIAGALSDAAKSVARRSSERERQKSELEARVQARTAELHAANEALAEREAQLRAIFDSTFQLTGLADLDGRIVAVNRAALEAGGVREADVIGKFAWQTPWWAGNPAEIEKLAEALDRVRTGQFVRYQGAAQLPVGERTIDFSLRPLYLHGGSKPDHILAEGHDVTELKAAQERADRSQKMEALGRLTGGVAHDFNNILTVIKGAMEMALKAPEDPRAGRLLAAALEAAQRGQELNKQLLGFARRKPMAQVRIEVADAVRRLAPLLRNAVGGARRLELDLQPVDGVCVVEPAQFETALLNLVVNARDATPEGGVVTVRVRPAGPRQQQRFPQLGPDFVCVEVGDTGHGIAPEDLGRVFDPFFTTKPPGQGTGLGLSQVYGFVQQSEGLIDVSSTPGLGTCFTIALPLDRANHGAAPEPKSFTRDAGPLKVLLVEDDPLVADVSETMLKSLGHEVTPARAGPEAMRVLEKEEGFDLLFTDIVMPEGINGVQLARMAQARRPALKVLLCSGWTADALDEAQAVNAPWPLLHKPFSGEELERAIAQATAPL